MADLLRYETSGYPADLKGWVDHELWKIAKDSGREYQREDYQDRVYTESIEQLEQELRLTEIALEAVKDPDISYSFAYYVILFSYQLTGILVQNSLP